MPDARSDERPTSDSPTSHDSDSSGTSGSLIPLVYTSLRRLARQRMAREAPEHTLGPTALVHEAFLRLRRGGGRWESRRHFYGAAAEAMRRILIERARRKRRIRHGGGLQRVPYEEQSVGGFDRSEDLLALDEALGSLEHRHPRKAEIVKLRYFAGLGVRETAEVLRVSPTTVKTDWTYARAWLNREIATTHAPSSEPNGHSSGTHA